MDATTKTDLPSFPKLRKYNAFMGALHLLQGLIILAISTDFRLPINLGYLRFDVTSMKLLSASDQITSIRIGLLVAVFFFLSAGAHLLLSTVLYPWYIRNLQKGINKARWYEYALSASLMMVLIAMLAGMYDLGSILLLFGLTATMNLFGLLMELHNQHTQRTDWTAFIFGSIAGIIPWVVVGLYFVGAAVNAGGDIPTFVYWIYGTIFLFFNTFAINMYLQYKQVGPWRDYLYGEKMYILLSLVAKSLLAWQIYAGTLRPV